MGSDAAGSRVSAASQAKLSHRAFPGLLPVLFFLFFLVVFFFLVVILDFGRFEHG
jgi:hypothetical protein